MVSLLHGRSTASGADPRWRNPLHRLNWGLLENGHPTIAGLLLFGFDPQRHLPFAQINTVREAVGLEVEIVLRDYEVLMVIPRAAAG
jgi:predicted HTH transcriptional regulator